MPRSQDRLDLVKVCRRLLPSDAEPLDVRIQELRDRVEIPGNKGPITTEHRVHALSAAHDAQRNVTGCPPVYLATSRVTASAEHDATRFAARSNALIVEMIPVRRLAAGAGSESCR